MRFGVCAPVSALGVITAAGFDYLEPGVTGMLQPEQPEVEVMPPLRRRFAAAALKPETFNLLLPEGLKVVGPEKDAERQGAYLETAFRRVKALGGEICVFGSGGARRIPAGWSLAEAKGQMQDFLTRGGAAAQRHGIVIAIEPLNVSECNFINSVAEAAALAEEVGHPAVGVLSDLYHIAHDAQSYAETRNAAAWLIHVHVAGLGRRAPVAEDDAFLTDYFAVLKQAGYAGRISIEANWEDLEQQAAEAREVLDHAWAAA